MSKGEQMMLLDGHVHIHVGDVEPAVFHRRMSAGGVDGAAIFSLPPASFGTPPLSARERLDNLFSWGGDAPHIYPVFWIDPLEEDAPAQVAQAIERGVAGFKVICDRYYPGDERALNIFNIIAITRRPIFFHSGILWDGKPSSRYNRPIEFEALLTVKGLKFSLAHISWPWCDELIAVYGKFQAALHSHPELGVEMFIDTTPGTPPIYRRDALTKLFTVGYKVARNVFFGTDSDVNGYDGQRVKERAARDNEMLREIGLDEETIDGVNAKNLLRFLGDSPAAV